jgi:hypothetical protein
LNSPGDSFPLPGVGGVVVVALLGSVGASGLESALNPVLDEEWLDPAAKDDNRSIAADAAPTANSMILKTPS